MKKKSGLADSPFFTPQRTPSSEIADASISIPQVADSKTQPSNHKTNVIRSDEAYASDGASEAREASETYASHEARKLIRRPIQMYEDQLNRMRAVSARSVLEGKPQLLRELFQEAIEEYLQKREPKYPKR